jgi:predicted nucleic acid-binding protein
VRYFASDDPPRAFAAAGLVDSDAQLFVSTGVLIELVHALRVEQAATDPDLAQGLIQFLSRTNVHVIDADAASIVAGLNWSVRDSARRIPDAILAAAAQRAACDYIASFDERFSSPSVQVRLL